MYKHLTPQEIEEFEKEFFSELYTGHVSVNGSDSVFTTNSDILSFIDTLIGKRVGGKRSPQGEFVDRLYNQILDNQEKSSRVIFSTDSPKRNEE